MRPRTLLVLFTSTAVGLGLFLSPPADPVPPPPTVPPSPFTEIDLDAIPDMPFARLHPRLRREPGQDYSRLRLSTGLALSEELRSFIAAESVPGGRWDSERRWNLLSGRWEGREQARPERPPYSTNPARSADGRVYVRSEYPMKGGEKPATSRLIAPHLPDGGTPLLPDVTDRSVYPLAVSPDGSLFYLADGREVQVWSTDPPRPIRTLFPIATEAGNMTQGYEVIPSPDGKRVAVFADEELSPLFREQGMGRCGLEVDPPPYHPCGCRQRLRVLDTSTWKVAHESLIDGWCMHWWASGDCLVSQSNGNGKSWERAYRTEVRHLNTGRVERHAFCLAWDYATTYFHATNRERRWEVAWGVRDRPPADTVSLFDLFSRRPPRVLRTGRVVDRVDFTPDSQFLVVIHTDDSVDLYDLCGVTKPAADYSAARLWDDLASENPRTVFRAARWAGEHPSEALPLLKREAEARTTVSAERVTGWITDLSSTDFRSRNTATRNLGEHLEAARPALERAAAAQPTLEAEERITALLDKPDPATAETRRSRWVVFAVEQMGTPESQAVLRWWAKGGYAFGLSTEAKEAAGRLSP